MFENRRLRLIQETIHGKHGFPWRSFLIWPGYRLDMAFGATSTHAARDSRFWTPQSLLLHTGRITVLEPEDCGKSTETVKVLGNSDFHGRTRHVLAFCVKISQPNWTIASLPIRGKRVPCQYTFVNANSERSPCLVPSCMVAENQMGEHQSWLRGKYELSRLKGNDLKSSRV